MGTVYTAMLYDEFNWNYVNSSKDDKIEVIEKLIPSAELIAQWPNFMVFDLDKKYPLMKNVGMHLLDNADAVWYYPDIEAYNLRKLEVEDLV
jgi:hypothetical protein